jgi:hypothetical protein
LIKSSLVDSRSIQFLKTGIEVIQDEIHYTTNGERFTGYGEKTAP